MRLQQAHALEQDVDDLDAEALLFLAPAKIEPQVAPAGGLQQELHQDVVAVAIHPLDVDGSGPGVDRGEGVAGQEQLLVETEESVPLIEGGGLAVAAFAVGPAMLNLKLRNLDALLDGKLGESSVKNEKVQPTPSIPGD